MLFLTTNEVDYILKRPFFSDPVTERDRVYVYYHYRENVRLYTVRFNLIPSFSVGFMIATLQSSLFQRFAPSTLLHVTLMHDLLLCGDPQSDPPNSFYIWRANTNRRVIDPSEDHHDFDMTLTQLNVINLCQLCADMNPSDFDINFVNSSVIVHRVLSLVLTFEGSRIDISS